MVRGDTDTRGVSSVIGVLLLVAVTVVLGTVVASFAFDIGSDSTNKAPQVSWEYEYNGGDIEATHASGDDLVGDSLSVQGISGSCANTGFTRSSTVTSGDRIQIGSGCGTSGVTIQIIWDDPETDNSAILAEFAN